MPGELECIYFYTHVQSYVITKSKSSPSQNSWSKQIVSRAAIPGPRFLPKYSVARWQHWMFAFTSLFAFRVFHFDGIWCHKMTCCMQQVNDLLHALHWGTRTWPIGAARPAFCNSVLCAESIDCRADRRVLQKAKSAGQIQVGEPHPGCTKHKVQKATIEKAHSARSTPCTKHTLLKAHKAHWECFNRTRICIWVGLGGDRISAGTAQEWRNRTLVAHEQLDV